MCDQCLEDSFPSIVFKVDGSLFSINSKYISSILQLPEYEALPEVPSEITGIFPYRGETVTMFDLRTALHMPSLIEEFNDFTQMLDIRKEEHINWVHELERCTAMSEPFTLATDPHKCAFGKWYYSYHSDINEVSYHLRKIEDPHTKLHHAAQQVQDCEKHCEQCAREICLQDVLTRAREEYMEKILGLLDETKEVFRSTVYHEMVLVLSGESKLGIVVDEVLAVDGTLSHAVSGKEFHTIPRSPYISCVKKSQRMDQLILELNVKKLVERVTKEYQL